MTARQRRQQVARLLETHEWTYREIATQCGVSTATVQLVAHDLAGGLDTENSAATDGLPRTVALRGQGNMP